MPAAAFGMDSLKEGGKIGLDITMVFSDDNGPAVIEWAQGCYVAKDSTVFAKVTLGEPMKAPAAASDDASDDTSAATAARRSQCPPPLWRSGRSTDIKRTKSFHDEASRSGSAPGGGFLSILLRKIVDRSLNICLNLVAIFGNS